jgi:hypothetical protein
MNKMSICPILSLQDKNNPILRFLIDEYCKIAIEKASKAETNSDTK